MKENTLTQSGEKKMKTIESKKFVDKDTIRLYEQIDGLEVIEQYLLFKGTDHLRGHPFVTKKALDEMAHIHYGLKVNATNKLYVGMYLDKFYKRADLVSSNGKIKVPIEIFIKVDEIHKPYKKEA